MSEANFTQTLSDVNAVRNALQADPQHWTTRMAHGIAKATSALHLERYFTQWWDAPLSTVHAVAHGVQRLHRSAQKKQLTVALELSEGGEAFWAAFDPISEDASDYPDLEALLPAPALPTAPQAPKSDAAPQPGAQGSTTSVGARVRHAKFGAGVIASVSGHGQTLELVIDFHGVGHKRLLHRFAQLEAI